MADCSATTASGGAPCPAAPRGVQRALLDAINQARATAQRCGQQLFAAAPPLTLDTRLQKAADRQAKDMARHVTLSHTGSDGSTLAERALDAGFDYAQLAENIAAGHPDVDTVVAGWLSSPGHCSNMMLPEVNRLGASYIVGDDDYGTWWVTVLGKRLQE